MMRKSKQKKLIKKYPKKIKISKKRLEEITKNRRKYHNT